MEPKSENKKSTSQNGFTIWHGMNFSTMLKFLTLRPNLHYSKLPRLAGLIPICMSNSFWSFWEDVFYARKVQQTQMKDPIFILGHWRSGTTLLHNLMTLDDRYCFPNMYQCLFPTHFLLTGSTIPYWTESLLPESRPMDNMATGWDIPQEDEFALVNMSLKSIYMLLAFQGRVHEYERFYTLKHAPAAERRLFKEVLDLLLRKITYLNKGKQIIVKSPGHTLKVQILLEMYPNAKFVYIYRHPYKVINSSFNLRRVLYPLNDFGKTTYEGLEEETMDLYHQAITNYELDKQHIPAGNLYELRYEDFEQEPDVHLRKIYETLNLGDFAPVQKKLDPMMPELKKYKKNKFQMDEARKRYLYEKLKFAFDLYGYDPELAPSANHSSV